MRTYSTEELTQALDALNSLLSKCRTALTRLPPGTAQHTLLTRRIDALEIATALIEDKLQD